MFLKVLVLYLLWKSATCERELLNIVGMFEEVEEENFRKAIHKVNSHPDFNFRFYLTPVKINPDDAFAALNNTCRVLQQGIVGIFGPRSTSNVNIVESICHAKKIPHILTRWVESEETGMQVNFFPHPHILMDAYVDIINNLEWNYVTVLYEYSESLLKLGYFIEKAGKSGIDVNIAQLIPSDDEQNRLVLLQLRESGHRNFMIYWQAADLESILLNLQQNGMLTESYNYFLTDLEAVMLPLRTFSYGKANIIGIELYNNTEPSQYYKNSGDKTLLPKTEAGLIFDSVYMFSMVLQSLNINKTFSLDCNNNEFWKDGFDIINALKMLNYTGLTGPIGFDSAGSRNEFELQILEINDGELRYTGSWNTSHGLKMLPIVDYDIPKKITVITTLTEPYAMGKATSEYSENNLEGFVIDLVEELSRKCGFEYTFITRQDMRIGQFDPEKYQWTGMIGDVLTGKADLAVGDVTITSERQEAVDFTIPFMLTGISILYRRSEISPSKLFSITDPFSFDLWVSIVITGIVVSIVLLILGRISSREWVNLQPYNHKSKYLTNELTFMNCIWFIVGSIMRQNYEIQLRSVGTRMVAAMWWFFTLIIVSFYVANLVVILTSGIVANEKYSDFSNFQELVKYAQEKDIKFGAKEGGATQHFFQEATKSHDDVYAKAWASMQANIEEVMVRDNAEGVNKVLNERYAFLMESTSLEYAVAKRCELQQIGGLLDSKGYGIAMRKGEPLGNCLDTAIVKLQASGKIDELKQQWWHVARGSDQCNINEEQNLEIGPLDMLYLWDVFLITVYGTVIAFLLAITEAILRTARKASKAKISLRKALKDELRFYFSFNRMIKPVANKPYSSIRTRGDNSQPHSEQNELDVIH